MIVASEAKPGEGHRFPDGLDCIYVTASRRDGRFTRMCIASIRHFYPDATIRLLKGGPLQPGLESELARFWDVGPAEIPERTDWGYGFVKLEPLFRPAGERFLVLDSDLVLAGPVLDHWHSHAAHFLVDQEWQDEAAVNSTYYDWRDVRAFDPEIEAPEFVFNSGQWFGTSGLVSRDDFAPWLDWSGPVPQLRHPGLFKSGEQGLFNYVLTRKAALGEITLDRRDLMLWPGNGIGAITPGGILRGKETPVVIHWAGLKRRKIERMQGGEILAMFERQYYRRLDCALIRRGMAHFDHHVGELANGLRHRWHRHFS